MPSRNFRWAIILCRFNDKPGDIHPREYYEDFYTSNGAGGVCDYWRAVTSGNWDLSNSQVFGWFTMNHASSEVSQLVFPGGRATLVQWAKDAAAANGVNLAPFNNVLAVHNYGVDHGAVAVGGPVLIVDQNSTLCEFGFICHEMGHGHGLPHSFSANPDFEYGDGWDLMSFATTTPLFDISFQGATGKATVGLNARNLEALGSVPAHRLWSPSGSNFSQTVILQSLNQMPMGNRGMVAAKILANSTNPARANGSSYTVEFRRRLGWDCSIPRDAVIVHEVRSNQLSFLPTRGLNLITGNQFVTPDPKVWISVSAIDVATDTATIRIWDAPEHSLRKEDSKPKVYVIRNGAKCWVTSPQVLAMIGSWADVLSVPDGGLDAIPNGPNVNPFTITVTPYPVPMNRQITVRFNAIDAAGHNATGDVKKDGVKIGTTNAPFQATFRATQRRGEDIPPVVTIEFTGFPPITVDCGF
jgi:hypothetical protein